MCRNQTLAESPAGLAADLRREIREQIKAGQERSGDRRVSDASLRRFHPCIARALRQELISSGLVLSCCCLRRFGAALPLHQAATRFDYGKPLTDDDRRRAEELLGAKGDCVILFWVICAIFILIALVFVLPPALQAFRGVGS